MPFLAGNFGVTVSFIDNGGNQVSRDYDMDPATVTDFTEALAAAGAILTDIIAFTDAALPQYRIYRKYEETALVLPASGVQVENTASMTLLIAGSGSEKANLNMPAPKAATFVSSSGPQANVLNTGNAVVTAFVDNFLPDPTGSFTISDGEKAARILNGKRVHKKSSKG